VCEREPWREKHDEARRACEEARFFDAVQLINGALEAFALSLGENISVEQKERLLTDPQAFVDEATATLPQGRAAELAPLYATRADVLMSMGGLARAARELSAASSLAPTDARVIELRDERDRLQRLQEGAMEEEATLASTSKLPAHLLTGFLGSGKTTLLNHILRGTHGKRFAVIENEFGEIGIDDSLIAGREEVGAEQIIEMNNGCICCTVRGDLIKGLKTILKKISEESTVLDGVIIETTGLADPAPVAQTFFADSYIQARMYLDGIITVVDARHVLQHLREKKPAGVENEAVEQIAFADRILLNKIDLATPELLKEVEEEIRKINRLAPVIHTQQSKVDVAEIIGIKCFSLDRVLEADAEFLRDDQEHMHDSSVGSVGIECGGECELEKLNLWIATLLKEKAVDIFRMKGVLAVKGCSSRFVFQGIHMIFGGQPLDDWREGEQRLNRLVFIGRNLDRSELESGFKATLVDTTASPDYPG